MKPKQLQPGRLTGLEHPAFKWNHLKADKMLEIQRYRTSDDPKAAHTFGSSALVSLFALLSGFIALAVFAPARAYADEEMSFQIVTAGSQAQCGTACPEIIAAEGQISDQTPGLFRAFLAEHANRAHLHTIVMMDSYGGKVLAAMELGRIFRQVGAAVIVAEPNGAGGRCFSACVYALMGGKKRVIPPESQVGVHRMVAYGDSYDSQFSDGAFTRRLDNGTVAGVLSRYCAMMGVNPAVISLAEHTSPDGLHILSRSEIARWNLAASRL